MQKKTLAKEKHTSRSRSTPDRRRANTHPAALFYSLGTCARKLAFAQTVRTCADCLAIRSLAAIRKSLVCAAACEGFFFDISNLNVRKCRKQCHSEERSDEESLMISLSFKRFFAALRMTGFYIVRVWRKIRDEPLRPNA